MTKTKILKSVLTKKINYVPAGYYDYPILHQCRGISDIEIQYTPNHMKLLIKPHGIRIERPLCRKDQILIPDDRALWYAMRGRDGRDLATLLNALDKYGRMPIKPWYKVWYLNLIDMIKKN